MNDVRTGRCLCGAVSFQTEGPLGGIRYCHCSQCRRQTGHFYAATDLALDRITIEGTGDVTWYAASDSAMRGFCRACGSALFWRRNDGGQISVMAGAFDLPSGLTEECHIFVADKGDYYAIGDGLPQHDRSTPPASVAD